MTLYEAQKELRGLLEADVRAAWNPKGVERDLPDTSPQAESDPPSLPRAYVVFREATPGEDEDGGSFCSEPVIQVVEISLRNCLPRQGKSGQGDPLLQKSAQLLRDRLGLKRSLGIYHGNPVRWLGETYIDPDAQEGYIPDWATVRVRLRFTLEVELS